MTITLEAAGCDADGTGAEAVTSDLGMTIAVHVQPPALLLSTSVMQVEEFCSSPRKT
jgi:hypothetical protein